MTDEQLTEWCVEKVKEWLATGHPSAWRAWCNVRQEPRRHPRLEIYALMPWGEHWSCRDDQGDLVELLSLPVHFRFADPLGIAAAELAVENLLGCSGKPTARITSEEMARLLEEAAAIATAPQDWRTVEMLPEDYYAL